MSDMSDIDDVELSSPSPEIVEELMNVSNLLPQKSKKMYEKVYEQFMEWRKTENITSFSENILIDYFEELSKKVKSPTLWRTYSILKSTLIKHRIDISKYRKLYSLLKHKSEGYRGKKSKTFSPNEMKTFINEAPDDKYLLLKVALVFGIMGACRRHELHELKFDDVKDLESTILVTIPNTKTNAARTFTVTGKYYEICKKYMNLRPHSCSTTSFFVNYYNGKCTVQNVGINKFGNMGKEIANYLNLPDPQLYTGHCFRRSSATVLVDAGGDITTLKRHGRWKSTTVAEAIEERPIEVKTEMPDIQEMILPGPSSAENFMELYPPRQKLSDWAVPQQAPPGTKLVVPPAPPLKKSLPPTPQPSPKPAIVKQAPSRPVSPPQPPPPPPEVCLRWNSYHSNMQATFPSLLNNEQFVDVTLACEGRSIKCHKMMLSACSSYFEELLSQNPCQHPIVLMKDLKFWEVQALVDFMYRGEVNVGQDKLPSLLAAAEALQIKGLAGPASTSSSHDEDSLPPSLPLAAEDYLDESASSPSSARRARKRRTLAFMPTPPQITVAPPRNPVGRPRLLTRPSPQPSTSSYVASEPPFRRARRSEHIALPVGEIKIEPVDIDISNDSIGNDSMDPIDAGFDMKKNFEDNGGTVERNDSSRQTDESRGGGGRGGGGRKGGGGGEGGDHEMTGSMCDDNSALITGHDSDLDYGNNNGMTMEQADTGATDDQNSEIQGYSYTEENDNDDDDDDDGPGMSSSDINPSYPEVVLNPDNASSDSILGHM